MAQYTDRWGLSILGPGSRISDDGYKFSDADRRLIDRLLAYAAEQHRHTGGTGTDFTPIAPPMITVGNTGGAIPSGLRYYYRFTVVDENGNESAPSPIATATMPAAVKIPSAPTLSYSTGSGTLGPGQYSYVLSAYTGTSNLETKATNSAFITIPGAMATNSITLILPALPAGADGYNIYRKTPSGLHYLWHDSVASPAPLDTWTDDGSSEGDCDRGLSPTNRTSNTNKVTIDYPGATPYVPDGLTWRIYRTQDPANWGNSYLVDLVPAGATPMTPVTYVDIGGSTRGGAPPSKTQVINAPSKIQLTDAAEVQGTLPPGLNVVPYQLRLAKTGAVVVEDGTAMWVNEFDQADLLFARAHLSLDSVPAVDDVIVDVKVFRPARENAWTSIWTSSGDRPTIPVGETIGDTTVAPNKAHLVAGDRVRVDVIQAGGGATPTDVDLAVNLLLMVQTGSTTASYVWLGT